MASSGYYYQQHRKYNRQVKDLKRHRNDLEKIEKAFTHNPVAGDPGDFNKRISRALDDHAEALSGDSAFGSLYGLLEAKRESEVLGDSSLSTAHRAIVDEIRRLDNEISSTQRKADQSWRDARNAEYREKHDD